MYDVPSYVWVLVLTGVIGIAGTTTLMLYRGALAARLRRRTAVLVAVVAGYVLGGWLLATGFLAGAGAYHTESGEASRWFGLAVAGVLAALLLATLIPPVRRLLAHPGTAARLTVPHTFRLVGISFLILMVQGRLPAEFALSAGLGDMAVGVAAPFVAANLARGRGRTAAIWFNWFGMLDLVVALSMGFLAGLGPFGFDIVPSTEPLALLPVALIPTAAVPLSIALHIVSLRRLRPGVLTSTVARDVLATERNADLHSEDHRGRLARLARARSNGTDPAPRPRPDDPTNLRLAPSRVPPGTGRSDGIKTNDVVIDVEEMRRSYGRFEAVQGVSLDVRRGEVFALLGTNGAGKTTTIEVLEGLQRPSAGRVRVLGMDPVGDRTKVRPRTGVMLQDGGFTGSLTVRETLEIWRPFTVRPSSTAEVVELVGLPQRLDVLVEQLSGGERRRLHLAVAVLGRPELLFLDEPTTGMDPASRRRTWDVIRQLNHAGATVLLSTHYLEEAEVLADRVAIMQAGRLVTIGPPQQVVLALPARITFRVPQGATGLPQLPHATFGVDGDRVTYQSRRLQADLTHLLAWANRSRVPLAELSARPASLEDVFLEIASGDAVAAGTEGRR